MSRRKRKQRDRPKPQSQKITTPRRAQSKLLILTIGLLAAIIWLNYRRSLQNQLSPPNPMPETEINAQPLARVDASGSAQPRFTALTPEQTGIHFVHPVERDHPLSFLYFSGMAAGGLAVGDVDDDGKPDIYVVGGPGKNKLYRQLDTPFRFEDITAWARVDGGDAWGCGATMVDINADGRLDIFVANYDSPNLLYINLGNGRFVEQGESFGLNMIDASLEGVFADYDVDGDLDLYLLTNRYENPDGRPAKPPIIMRDGKPAIHPDFAKYYEVTNDDVGYGPIGRSDGLLRNNGNGTFTDVSYEAGLHGYGHGLSATWWDYNQDGKPDLYVGNDFKDVDHFYHNNGDGTFTDVVRERVPHTTWFSMGSDAGDVDGDGWIDLLTADMSSTTHFKQKTTMGPMSRDREFLETAEPRQYMRNALLLNTGTNRFLEGAYLAGLANTDWTWAVKLIDLNCDGWLDVFVTNGSVRSFTDSDRPMTFKMLQGRTAWDIYKDAPLLKERNLAFQNHGNLAFENVSQAWGLDHMGVSMAAVHADLDRDGDLDLVIANLDEPLLVYRNNSADAHRVTIRLHGRGKNRFGIGARVVVRSRLGEQVRELYPSRGFLASNDPLLHFGLGADTQIEKLTVMWPSGRRQEFSSQPVDHHFTIVEPAGERPVPLPASADDPKLFHDETLEELTHVENEFDDYSLQSLLPYKLSQLGPAMAIADLDNNGRDDIFLGGSAGYAGQVAQQDGEGRFQILPQPALEQDRAAEDMGAVWLDVDLDDDLDLFVVGGGNEAELAARVYGPRLYLNDGTGKLSRAPSDAVPDIRTSGGPIAAADFDRDGDTDLFLGGRQIPGKYPLPGRSYILVNVDGRFVEQAEQLAPGLADIGMVTAGLWTDVDNDGWLDLMLTTEWGSIRCFHNQQGALVDVSAIAGLTAHLGWWTGITGADLDRDGDIDFIATNLGLNTKYHTSDEHPFRLYYGDFDGTGTRQLVEAEYEGETLFPMRGKSCSTHAMPFLADKFTTYKDFALASLQDIYSSECLDNSYQCSANTLASAVLLNDGKGHFTFLELPVAAQLSPGFGVVATELTGDGIPDVLIVQNFFAPQPETGRMDGGCGVLLQGQGDGTFKMIPPRRSGIVLPEDATAASAIDLNADGRPDLVVATNNGPVHKFMCQQTLAGNFLAVRLQGVTSRAQAAGARIIVTGEDGWKQTTEIHAGSGYLSQQAPVFFFGRDEPIKGTCQVTVTWPDGRETSLQVQGLATVIMPTPP